MISADCHRAMFYKLLGEETIKSFGQKWGLKRVRSCHKIYYFKNNFKLVKIRQLAMELMGHVIELSGEIYITRCSFNYDSDNCVI